jgi:branched-chain amino acid transport system substrate-binding protein
LSGPQASIGEAIKNGAQMAIEERSDEFSEMGFELEFLPRDDQADPRVGVTVAESLLSDPDVLANVAHFNSGVALPAMDVYNEDNLLMVSPANTAVEITQKGYKCVNRIVGNDKVQGAVAVNFSYNDLNSEKVFIIHDKTTYGQGVAEEFKTAFEELGGEVLAFEGINAGDSDFSGVLTNVQNVNPDQVFFGGIYPEGSLIIKQMKEKNITAKFVGPDGMDSGEVVNIAGDSAIGTYYTSTAGDCSSTDEGAAWAQSYEEQFNKAPENYAAYGYDATQIALNSLKVAIENNNGEKPTREMVADAAKEIEPYSGIATEVELDENGDNKKAVIFVCKFEEASYPANLVNSISANEVFGE